MDNDLTKELSERFGISIYAAFVALELTNQAILLEREACAKICDSVDNYANPMTAKDCADAIRSRTKLEEE